MRGGEGEEKGEGGGKRGRLVLMHVRVASAATQGQKGVECV